MKNSTFHTDKKNNKIEVWFENGSVGLIYWKKTNGISFIITKRQYEHIIKTQ